MTILVYLFISLFAQYRENLPIHSNAYRLKLDCYLEIRLSLQVGFLGL
jgi:hypothetical protein